MDTQPCRTGNLPDDYHPRDWSLFTKEEFAVLTSRESSQDTRTTVLLDDLPPVYDQGDIGSCTANATLAALRYAHHKLTGSQSSGRSRAPWSQFIEKGPAPDRAAKVKKDSGTKNRICINSLLIDGVCSEIMWPYGTPKSNEKSEDFENLEPPPNPCEPLDMAAAENEARGSRHPGQGIEQPDFFPRAISFYRIFDPSKRAKVEADGNWKTEEHPPISALEQTIRDGWPFIFGMPILDDADPRTVWKKDANKKYILDTNGKKILVSSDIDEDGVLLPPPKESADKILKVDGRHALMVVGFDSEKRRFLAQNSWGTTEWPPKCAEKMQGKMWMPYEWFEQKVKWGDEKKSWVDPIAQDFWVIKYGGNEEKP